MVKDRTLDELANFHGHLGPYVVVGYKMGLVANSKLSEDPFAKEVLVKTGPQPPISCIVDGIQYSSGCTLGKGNIQIEDKNEPEASFTSEDESLEIKLKERINSKIEETSEGNLENLAKKIYEMKAKELFEISYR